MRLVDGALAFRDSENHNQVTQWHIDDDVEKACFSRASHGYELRLYLGDHDIKSFSGFKKEDHDKLKEFFPDLEQKVHSVRGWNFGDLKVDGKELIFTDPKSTDMFEIPLINVSNCVSNKAEISLEFHTNEKAAINLMEMRFHTSGEDVAKTLKEDIMEHADVLEAAGRQAIANFNELSFLIPRARHEMKLYDTFMHIRGKSNDYKIAYTTIQRMFCLNHMDGLNFFFVISLDPPLKQGQTRYPFLVMQLPKDDEIAIELQVEDDEEFEQKYQGKLSKELNGPLFQIFAVVLKHICQKKVHATGDSFASKNPCIQCSFKANQGYLYPLERAFMYLVKPPIYIRFEEIEYVNFARGSNQRKNFELEVSLKNSDKTMYNFQSIEREEYSKIYQFCQDKNIRIKNAGKGGGKGAMDDMDMGAGSDGDQEFDPYKQRVMAEGADGSDDDSDDEDYDYDKEEQKAHKKHNVDEEYNSGSGGSTDLSGTEDEDSDDPNVIRMDDDEMPRAKKAKRVTTKPRGEPRQKKAAKVKDPNAPKRGLSSYMIYCNENRAKWKAENPDMAVTEIMKLGGEKWKEVSDEEKASYQVKADADKARYEEEMKSYVPPEGMAAKTKRGGKKEKDPNQPKKPPTPFFAWMGENRERIKTENPDATIGQLGKLGGEQWKALGDEEKKKYADAYESKIAAWKDEMMEYEKSDLAKEFREKVNAATPKRPSKPKGAAKPKAAKKSSPSGGGGGGGSKNFKSAEFVQDSDSSSDDEKAKKKSESSGSSADSTDSD